MVWPRLKVSWFSKDSPTGHSERKKKRHIEEEVGKVSHSIITVGAVVVSPTVSWAQLMKGGANRAPLTALSFPNSKKVCFYCWVDRESFPVIAWQNPALNSQPYGNFLHHNQATLTA